MTAGPSHIHCQRSEGLVAVPFLDGAFVHDMVTNTFHRVGPGAAAILLAEDEVCVAQLIEMVTAGAGIDMGVAEAAVLTGIESLRSLGLVGRLDGFVAPDPIGGSELPAEDMHTGAPFVVHDKTVLFRSTEWGLLDRIEAVLGVAAPRSEIVADSTVNFDLVAQADGPNVTLYASEEWEFPTEAGLIFQLPGVINDFAARSHTTPVLHAGGVVTPSGRLLLVSGGVDHGKSTLIASLVQRGCRYLGDELIGIEPLTLDALPYPKPFQLDETSREILGVSAANPPNVRPQEVAPDCDLVLDPLGPIDRVIISCFELGVRRQVEELDVDSAAKALLDQTTNLRRVGEPGLAAICKLATRVPVTRIVHGDSVELAADLLAEDEDLGVDQSA